MDDSVRNAIVSDTLKRLDLMVDLPDWREPEAYQNLKELIKSERLFIRDTDGEYLPVKSAGVSLAAWATTVTNSDGVVTQAYDRAAKKFVSTEGLSESEINDILGREPRQLEDVLSELESDKFDEILQGAEALYDLVGCYSYNVTDAELLTKILTEARLRGRDGYEGFNTYGLK